MGKRIVRLHNVDSLSAIESVIGKEVSVVLRDDGVLQGEAIRGLVSGLILRNKRFAEHLIPFQDIREIQYDYTSKY